MIRHSQVVSCNEQYDGEIIAKVTERLRRHSHLGAERIWCEVDDGTLFLRGEVPSFFYKQLAQEAVQNMAGVDQVINTIEVVWQATFATKVLHHASIHETDGGIFCPK